MSRLTSELLVLKVETQSTSHPVLQIASYNVLTETL